MDHRIGKVELREVILSAIECARMIPQLSATGTTNEFIQAHLALIAVAEPIRDTLV